MARIFLCYASEDKGQVREVYQRLRAIDEFEPWLDEEDLSPGQDWAREIPRALQASDFILIFLSRNSVAKRGYVQREMKLALDAWQELPGGTIHTIPVRLDDCEVPEDFCRYHWANLFEPTGFDRIVRVIRAEIAKRSGPTPPPRPQSSPRPIDAAPQQGKAATPRISEKDRPEVHRHTTSDAHVITERSRSRKRRLVIDKNLMSDEQVVYKGKIYWFSSVPGVVLALASFFGPVLLDVDRDSVVGTLILIIALIAFCLANFLMIKARITQVSTECAITT